MRLALLLFVAAFVQDPPPTETAATGGRIQWGKDEAAATKRSRLEQRAVFLYFTDGGTPCKALDAGAFSASEVVAASMRVLPVLLECPDANAHADLRKKLNVSAFPTLILVEPDGKTTTELAVREAAEVAAELNKMGAKFPGRDVLWLSSMESGLERAKSEKRPLAIYLHSPEEDLAAAQDKIVKVGGQSRIDKFVWVELSATTGENDPLRQKYDYFSLPAVAVIDPRYPEPKWITTFEIKASAKPKDVQEKFEKVLKKYKDTKIKK